MELFSYVSPKPQGSKKQYYNVRNKQTKQRKQKNENKNLNRIIKKMSDGVEIQSAVPVLGVDNGVETNEGGGVEVMGVIPDVGVDKDGNRNCLIKYEADYGTLPSPDENTLVSVEGIHKYQNYVMRQILYFTVFVFFVIASGMAGARRCIDCFGIAALVI